MNNIPHHIAIIMDGNRRWARDRGYEVLFGHEKGAGTLKMIAREAHDRCELPRAVAKESKPI